MVSDLSNSFYAKKLVRRMVDFEPTIFQKYPIISLQSMQTFKQMPVDSGELNPPTTLYIFGY